MISYIILENFKSFKKIKLDLRNANKMPKKIAFIYGENGSGKTNLVASIFFLRKTFETLAAQEKLKSFDESNLNDLIEGIDNNAKKNIYESIIKNTFKTLESLINDYKMIGSTQNMVIEIGFYLDNKEGIYTLKFDNEKIVSESLYFTINKRVGEIFSITKDSILLNDSIFIETKYKKELLEEIKKYWGKHSFMSIIFYEMNIKNNEYFNSNLNSNFISVISMLKKLTVLYKTKESREAIFSIPFKFLSNLESGIINTIDDEKELKVFENFLNIFFTQLYSDIKKVYYNITPVDSQKSKFELYVQKNIYNKLIEVPFKLESTGTQKLLEIIPSFISSLMGGTALIDEVDSGIHDVLMNDLIQLFYESLSNTNTGQFIATTHNTLLMKQLPKECIYIIVIDANGNKEIISIDEYKFRTQKNNNIQNKYINGDYEGTPITGFLDFNEMIEDIQDSLSKKED